MMHWLRELHFVEAEGDFVVRAVHLAGVQNGLADHLSRNHVRNFHADLVQRFGTTPSAVHTEVQVPRS